MAEGLVRNGNPGDGFTVILLAGPPVPIVPGPSNNPEKVIDEIRKLKPTHAAADAAPALKLVADLLARSPRAYPRRFVLRRSVLARARGRAYGFKLVAEHARLQSPHDRDGFRLHHFRSSEVRQFAHSRGDGDGDQSGGFGKGCDLD